MSFSAVLLAGGESRRMGQDKATLIFREKPLWRHQIETLRELNPAEVFISGRDDPGWRPNEIEFISDEPPSRGPLSGLLAALKKMRVDHLLVLAIDMPFMTATFLNSLAEKISSNRGVIPKIGDWLEPLAAIYPRDAVGDVLNALAGADYSMQALAGHLINSGKVVTLDVPENSRTCFRNFNEPADLLR